MVGNSNRDLVCTYTLLQPGAEVAECCPGREDRHVRVHAEEIEPHLLVIWAVDGGTGLLSPAGGQRAGLLGLSTMVKLLLASALVVLVAAEEAAAQDATGSSNFEPRKRRLMRCMLCERSGRRGPLL